MNNTVGCRLFQAAVKVGSYFMGYRTPEYLEGPGSAGRVPELLDRAGVDRVLVVTGPHIRASGLADGMFSALDEAGVAYTVFSQVEANPTDRTVEAGLRQYLETGSRGLVAFGGGSPMDCAKAIAARAARPDRTVAQLQGLLKVRRRTPPLVAVPTTAGTGSETTVAAVITDTATHRKASINDPAILPGYAVLDPELTVGLSPFTTAITGMDALCHAVEAYTNHTYNTPLEDDLARRAVALIHENLLRAWRDGSDLGARQNMQRAAFYAGRAFTRGCVGYVHAVGHTLGGLYGVPHGLAMAILLPHVMRQYGPAARRRLAELAGVCGMKGNTEADQAERFLAWIESLKAEMGLPAGADMIRAEDTDRIIAWAMKEANPLYPVPVVWGRADFTRLLDTVRRA